MARKVIIKIDNVTIEFDDDAQAKEKPCLGDKIQKLWKEAFEKGLVAVPPPEQSSAKEKPPEGGKTCERTPPDPELLRKAQARVDARKRGSDDSVDILCATLDKVIRCVAQDIFKPPN